MTTYRLFSGVTAHVSTAEYHQDRQRARHLEDPHHRDRMEAAAEFVREAMADLDSEYPEEGATRRVSTLSDCGAGDGGFLSLVSDGSTRFWGYDLCPANIVGADERGVMVLHRDVFNTGGDGVVFGNVVVMTEVLEHLTDPYGVLAMLRARTGVRRIIASSPFVETAENHSPDHAWAWDLVGYADMFRETGWKLIQHVAVGGFQVLMAK